MTKTRIVDKVGALDRERPLKLDLGCGPARRAADFVGVDVMDGPAVDIVGDVLEVLGALADESVEEIYSSHLFEHIDDLAELVDEVERVLVIGGKLNVVVPHFSNAYYYSDPTHRRPFGLYTFSYFAEDSIMRRRVPSYGHTPRLRLEGARLGFRSEAQFPGRRLLKQGLASVVNSNVWLKEFYEENLTGILPCYELHFELVKVR